MQVFRPPSIQVDRQQNYAGRPLDQSADGLNQFDHPTHPLLIKILITLWQLIGIKVTSARGIINHLPLWHWKNWSTWANTTSEGAVNE